MPECNREAKIVEEFNLDELPFDLFTRSIISSEIIKEVKNRLGKPLSILDVGGRNGCLRVFLQQYDISILDLRLPESSSDTELFRQGKYFISDIQKTNFEDGSFDVVTSFDMIEHLQESQRKKAFQEMLRISNSLVIIAAPFRSKSNEKAEILLNQQFKHLTGNEHEWLKEHIENKLPEHELIEDFVKQEGLEFIKIHTNNVNLWLIMQNFIFLAYKFSIDPKTVYQKYNENFKVLGDMQPPTYRTIYAISQNERLNLNDIYNKVLKPDSDINLEKRLDLLQCIFSEISKCVDQNKEKSPEPPRKFRDSILPIGTIRRKVVKAIYLLFFDWNRFKQSLKRDYGFWRKGSLKSVHSKVSVSKQADEQIIVMPESALAHKYCVGKGLEIGASAHNPFGLNTLNVDFNDSMDTEFKKEEIKNCGKATKVDIVAYGDDIPLPDESQDFVISSHVIEHFTNPIKALLEWDRLVKPGGIIFIIVPHKDRTFDKDRKCTSLDHLIEDYKNNNTEIHGYLNCHYHCWTTETFVELINYMIKELKIKWDIAEIQDVDDKVGNGFTIVLRKMNT